MNREKRRWIYSGIGVPVGVALVRPVARPLAPRSRRVLIVGGAVARSIAPALGLLARESGGGIRLYTWRHPSVEAAALKPAWLKRKIIAYRPSVVILGADPPKNGTAEIDELVRKCGAAPLWLTLRGRMASGLSAETLHLVGHGGRMQPTAAGYAAWAAAVWRMIG